MFILLFFSHKNKELYYNTLKFYLFLSFLRNFIKEENYEPI